MKTKEELQYLKSEVEALGNKLAELSEEELKEVTGGRFNDVIIGNIDGSIRGDSAGGFVGLCGKLSSQWHGELENRDDDAGFSPGSGMSDRWLVDK